jgi:hypothetical protein
VSELDQIVQITITRESTAVATASFQIPLVLATFTNFSERTRTYTDITGVGEDFTSTSNVHKIATKLFGQSSVGAVPPSIVVGRRQVDTVTYTPTVADNTLYSVTLNGTPYTFTSGVGATATTIVTGLKAALGSPTGITVTGTTTLILTTTVLGTPWSVIASTNLVGVNTVTEDWVEALEAVEQENNVWYGIVSETHVSADQEALSDAINARRKLYGTSTADTVTPTTGITDIAYKLKAKTADRTFGIYLPTADTEFPEAAWMGAQLPYTPGSNDWDFKRAVGVTVSNLTDTQRVNLRGKDCNMYTTVAGVNIFQDGDTFGGSPIDEIVGIDWLYARLQEGVYFRLINSLKVPMTNPGLAIIENEIRSVLSQAEANGLIDRGWSVSTPDVSTISPTLRAQRTAGVFVFRARLAGSIRKVIINGFLSV